VQVGIVCPTQDPPPPPRVSPTPQTALLTEALLLFF